MGSPNSTAGRDPDHQGFEIHFQCALFDDVIFEISISGDVLGEYQKSAVFH